MVEKTRHIGPYSSSNSLAKLDGRTKEAALLRRVRSDLTLHVGGKPSATEKALIERCAWLSLRVAQLDCKMAGGQPFTDHDAAHYLAWSNCLTRTLARLGLKAAAPKTPTLADHIAALTARQASDEEREHAA